jgi:hypothetical protein
MAEFIAPQDPAPETKLPQIKISKDKEPGVSTEKKTLTFELKWLVGGICIVVAVLVGGFWKFYTYNVDCDGDAGLGPR